MASLKRKRGEFEDGEDGEVTYGKQILPVAELPDDFDSPPADGMQYLFTVRRETRSLPDISRVANPYETASFPESPDLTPSHPALPSLEWRTVYKERFCNFRKNFDQPTIHVQYAPDGIGRKIMPDKRERELWWAFLSGRPETEWNPPRKPKGQKAKQKARLTHGFADHDETILMYEVPQSGEQILAREPVPSLLKAIDEAMALHLLMYFSHWFNLYLDGSEGQYHPTECHARWVFSLLARVEDHISGDDIASLRGLARTFIAVLEHLIQGRSQPERFTVPEDSIHENSCWIIISTVVEIWQQHDLWMDVETMLRRTITIQHCAD